MVPPVMWGWSQPLRGAGRLVSQAGARDHSLTVSWRADVALSLLVLCAPVQGVVGFLSCVPVPSPTPVQVCSKSQTQQVRASKHRGRLGRGPCRCVTRFPQEQSSSSVPAGKRQNSVYCMGETELPLQGKNEITTVGCLMSQMCSIE